MARTRGILICILLVVMDTAAGILGIQAEISQSKSIYLKKLVFGCKEPVHRAFELGIAAAVLLALAHAIAVFFGGRARIWSREELQISTANKKMAAATSILSWIILVAALAMLAMAVMSNSSKLVFPCGFPHHHFFAIGGMLCFLHGMFAAAYYVSAAAEVAEDPSNKGDDPSP